VLTRVRSRHAVRQVAMATTASKWRIAIT